MAQRRQFAMNEGEPGTDAYNGPGAPEQDIQDFIDSLGGGGQDAGGGMADPTPDLKINLPGAGGDAGELPKDPGVITEAGRGVETPRERSNPRDLGGDAPGGGQATLRRPSAPTPMAGSTFNAGSTEQGGSTSQSGVMGGPSGPAGVIPFAPMGGPDAVTSAMPKLRGLYGKAGGLQGGGLGVPGATSAAENSTIDDLIKQLMSKGDLRF